MGWETRKGQSYYYRKERGADGRVRSVYVGTGEVARLFARSDEVLREKAEAEAHRLRSLREEGAAPLAAYDALARYVRLAVAALLTLEGYRSHRRQWRRRRVPLPSASSAPAMPRSKASKDRPKVPDAPVPGTIRYTATGPTMDVGAAVGSVGDDAIAAVRALVERCTKAKPDAADLEALRRWIGRDDVTVPAEELAAEAVEAATRPGQNAGLQEMKLAGFRNLRTRMGYADADPVERLLITQAATAWVILQQEQTRHGWHLSTPGGYSLPVADDLDKRVSRASGRFLRAVESLEKVRALRTLTAVKAGEARPFPALPPHSGDGAAPPAEAVEVSATA